MRILRGLIYSLLVTLCVATVVAQDDCPAAVQAAIQAVGDLCATTGLNQACYGNLSLSAEPRPDVTSFVFDKPGDRARLANLQALQLKPFDVTNNEWGVALLRVQANIPDTLPGQNVSFLLFGDVTLENRAPSTPSALLTVSADTILWGAPQSDAPLVGALSAGQEAFALSRSADGQWVRVELNSSDSRTGWIPAASVPEAGELPLYNPSAAGPMQAFSIQTGLTGTRCAAAPPDGILVQTPAENIKIQLTVNDVNIELGSTAFIQAQPSSDLKFSVIEGAGKAEVNGQTVEVPAGSWVKIPMDANLEPAGEISQPMGYEPGELANLPISLLERPITIADPISSVPVVTNCVPRTDWTFTYTIQSGNTLSQIAGAAGVALTELAQGNCIADVNRIVAGQPLRVPREVILPTSTPPLVPITPSPTASLAPSATPTLTLEPTVDVSSTLPQITSGRWQLTVTVQFDVCASTGQQPSPTTSTTVTDVTVANGEQALRFTISSGYIFNGDGTYVLNRVNQTTFSGSWVDTNGAATLTMVADNQAMLYSTAPCIEGA